ncbi:WXG100 family type VII secretion target [Nocardia blacklockiae]|uniref:WXG100 family type VII secretion target n=1 Tax=Nocardia blacklockiae TaxID=480036 RepID=UPI001893FB50|nr:ESX-1 secretion-associated protein [Nocardia blacklockiae]MBF6172905.1 ESX-1 secretion-associated protein [Nocardia blacklockiae]
MNGDGGQSNPNSGITVVPDEVRAVGQYVYNIADTMRQALDAASREVDGLLSQGWTGDAADEFSEGWTDTRDGGTKLMTALTSLAEKLGVTAENYRNTDDGSSTGFTQLNMS